MLQKIRFSRHHAGAKTNAREDDRPSVARFFFENFNPTTKSGTNALKKKLYSFVLGDCNQNATETFDYVQMCHDKITCSGCQDDEFMLKVLNALEAPSNEYFLFPRRSKILGRKMSLKTMLIV